MRNSIKRSQFRKVENPSTRGSRSVRQVVFFIVSVKAVVRRPEHLFLLSPV